MSGRVSIRRTHGHLDNNLCIYLSLCTGASKATMTQSKPSVVGRSWQLSPPRGGRTERGGTGWESWSLLKPFPHTQVSFCWEFLGDEQVTSHTCDGHPEGELKPFIGRHRDRWFSGFRGQGGWVLSPWKNVGLVSWKPESSAQPPLEGSRVSKLTS